MLRKRRCLASGFEAGIESLLQGVWRHKSCLIYDRIQSSCLGSVGLFRQVCPPLPPPWKKSTSELPYIEDPLPGQRLLKRFLEGLLHKPSQVIFFPTFEDPKSYFEVDFHSHTPRGSADDGKSLLGDGRYALLRKLIQRRSLRRR